MCHKLPTSVSSTAVLVLLALDYARCQSVQARQNIAQIATIQAWPSVGKGHFIGTECLVTDVCRK